MIELPVVYSAGSLTKLNSAVVKSDRS